MPKNDSHKILIVAAETSSCLYAQRLLELWRQEGFEVEAFGIGNREMEKLGFECLGRAEELAVVGIQEVISHWGVIKKAFYDLVDAAEKRKPDVVLLLDYPDFNLRFAKKLNGIGVPIVYYISPQIWAWRQGRVKLIKKIISKMLVLFPFEVDFYQKHGVKAEFVGHPLLDELSTKFQDSSYRSMHRKKYGVMDNEMLLALMPGSRRSELKHHLQTQIETAKRVLQKHPNVKVALFVAPNFSKEEIQAQLSELDFPLMIIKDDPFEMINLADLVLCASGTATLMVGLLAKPMVVMYKMNPLTAFLARRFVTATAHFGLINLILNKRVVPEVFQQEANPEKMSQLLEEWILNPLEREKTANELAASREKLGAKGATIRVAKALEEYWRSK